MRTAFVAGLAVIVMALAGCETNTPNSAANRIDTKARAKTALQEMTAQDPHLQDLINSSAGYAIFPDVGNAAVGIGGASGLGEVYKNGQPVGEVKLAQGSIGPQVGGQTYSELIIFQDEKPLNRMMNNSFEWGANASATIVKAGAAAAGQFANGVQVFVLPKGGLEVGANINGQKFTFMGNNSQ